MSKFQATLDGKAIIPLCVNNARALWEYQGRKTDESNCKSGKMVDTEKKVYPPAVFMRVSKAGTSLYGFVPNEGIEGGKSLVMNRDDLVKLLKKEVEFVKVGILEPSGKKEVADDTEGL